MELFFTDINFKIRGTSFPGVPFFLDQKYKLIDEINEFFSEYLLIDGNIGSKSTLKSYAYWLLDFFKWAEANGVNWKVVTTPELVAYRNWSLEECMLTAGTVNSRISVLKRFFEYAFRNRIVLSNPIIEKVVKRYAAVDSDFLSHAHVINISRNVLSLKTPRVLPLFFSDEDLIKILSATSSERLKLMICLMLETGMRRAEVSKLPDELIENTILLAQSLGVNKEIPLQLPAKICKGNKGRTVYLSYSTVIRLKHYRNTIRPKYSRKYKLKNKIKPEAFWLTFMGTEYQPESLSKELLDIGKKVGIDANPHKFRHTFATNFYAITNDLRLLQKLLGHSNIQTTTIYEHTAAADRFGILSDYHRHLDKLEQNESLNGISK